MERILTCPEYGKEFVSRRTKKKYCSPTCQIKYNHRVQNRKVAKEYKLKKCPVCGKEFVTSHDGHKYCSDECRKSAKRKQNRLWYQANKEQVSERNRRRCGTNNYRKKLKACVEAHDNCFACDTPDGECRFN